MRYIVRTVSLGDLLFMQNIITTNYDNHCVILWYYFMEQLSYIWSIFDWLPWRYMGIRNRLYNNTRRSVHYSIDTIKYINET